MCISQRIGSLLKVVTLLGSMTLSSGCGDPALNGLDPSSGAPHTLVELNSSNSIFTVIYWDAGTVDETRVPGGFLGDGPFSVPHGAGLGIHGVQLRRSSGSSAVQNFTTTDPATAPFPEPRLEYIVGVGPAESTPGNTSFYVCSEGANIDVGTEILINGVAQETIFWRALRYNDGGIDPTSLNYPVYHYVMAVAAVEAPTGSTMSISLRNDGGAISNVKMSVVPDAASLDSDGDGLLDDWEINGYDADGDGTIDVDLPALGANPNLKDLFIEVDFMNGKVPTGNPWNIVEQAFADAPVLNIAGPGIHLHIDWGQATYIDARGDVVTIPISERNGGTILPQSDYIRMDGNAAPFAAVGETTVNFFTLKGNVANFDPDRLNIFHYAIIADKHGHSNGASGRAEIWGNDFFVTLRDVRLAVQEFVAGTFMHEFGHNLNLRHGGGDDGDNNGYEPNHISVMSYYSSNGTFTGTYQVGGVDIDCDCVADGVYDYSRGCLNVLDETVLNENIGMCNNVAIDWNNNGVIEAAVNFNISGDGATTLDDFNSWGRLYWDYRSAGSSWNNN